MGQRKDEGEIAQEENFCLAFPQERGFKEQEIRKKASTPATNCNLPSRAGEIMRSFKDWDLRNNQESSRNRKIRPTLVSSDIDYRERPAP